MGEQRPKPGFRAALESKDFRLLLGSLATSGIGDWFYNVALVVLILEETRSPGWVAAVTVGRLVPYVLLGPIGGELADRFDRRVVMIAADLVRAALMLLLALAAILSAPPLVAVGIAFLSTAAGTPFFPAVAAVTPTVVDERNLVPANALISTFDSLALAVGPALGGLLLVVSSSPTTAFVINAGTFLVSALCLSRMARRLEPLSQSQPEGEGEPSFAHRLAVGARAVTSSATVMLLIALIAAATFTYGQEGVLYPLVSRDLLGTGEEGVGFLYGAIGAGSMLAAGLANRATENARVGVVLFFGSVAAAVPLLILPFVRQPLIAYALVAIEGGSFIFVDVLATTLLQRAVAREVTARVFGILDSVLIGATVLGAVLAPFVLEAAGLRAALWIAGGLLVVLTSLCLPRLAALDRATDSRRRALRPRVELLGRLDIFDGLSPTSLEALAASVAEEQVPADTALIREGEEPGDFYVIVSGSMEVLSSGESPGPASKVSELGPGDYAGEIGLVERIPRTATVRATSDSLVYRVSGTDFLAAVNQAPAASGALFSGIAGRLARTHPTYEPTRREVLP